MIDHDHMLETGAGQSVEQMRRNWEIEARARGDLISIQCLGCRMPLLVERPLAGVCGSVECPSCGRTNGFMVK